MPVVNPQSYRPVGDDSQGIVGSDSELGDSDADIEGEQFAIISRPTVIDFPRFCAEIVQVSCGKGHIMALTNHYEMYSWGNGEHGVLGFGTLESISKPTLLQINQNDQVL